MNFVIGGLEDQLGLHVWGLISNDLFRISNDILHDYEIYKALFFSLMFPFKSNEPILWGFISSMLSMFGPGFLNLFAVVTVLLIYFASRKYFAKYHNGWVYALLFTFSTYTYVHLGKHVPLTQSWVVPLFFILYEKKFVRKSVKSVIIGAFLAFSVFISNYLGFFLILAFGALSIFSLWRSISSKESQLKTQATDLLRTTFVFLALTIPVLLPYINANYFEREEIAYLDAQVDRSESDFFTFSSRPWYFVLPPIKNPILGGITQNLVDRLESTEYFLADDYFANEHQANFLGLFFILTLSMVLARYYFSRIISRKPSVTAYLLTATVLMLLMMPPFLTFSGIKIVTPGFLISEYFPMFRVTARMIVVVHFLLLAVYAEILDIVSSTYRSKKYLSYFLITLLVVTFLETYIPIKAQRVPEPSQTYAYIDQTIPQDSVIAIYPNNKTRDAFLWISEHNRKVANPKGLSYRGFNSQDFTEALETEEALTVLKGADVDYLILFKERGFYSPLPVEEELLLVSELPDAFIYQIL